MDNGRTIIAKNGEIRTSTSENIASSIPSVALKIFRCLCARDISNCSKVSKKWNFVSKSVMKERLEIFIKSKAYIKVEFQLNVSHRDLLPDQEMQLLFGMPFLTRLHDLWITPKVVIVFGTPNFMHRPDNFYNSFPMFGMTRGLSSIGFRESVVLKTDPMINIMFQEVMYLIKDQLPKQCPVVCCENDIKSGMLHAFRLELQTEGITALAIPNLPGVETRAFSVASEYFSEVPEGIVFRNIEISGLSDLSPEITSKCLILFHSLPRNLEQRNFMSYALSKYKCDLTISVRIISGCSLHKMSSSLYPLGSGLLFRGDNIHTHCITLYAYSTINCITSQLAPIKLLAKAERKCVAFIFSNNIHREVAMLKFLKMHFERVPVFAILSDDISIESQGLEDSCVCGNCKIRLPTREYRQFDSASTVLFIIFDV